MGASSTRQSSLSFGLFNVDLASGQLFRRGQKVALQEKPWVPSEGWKLAVIPLDGGPPVHQFAVPSGAGGVRVRWSPSGKGLQYVVTQNGVSNLWEQPLSGGKPKQFTEFTSGQIFDFNWTLDRTRLLLTRGSENRDAVLLHHLTVQ